VTDICDEAQAREEGEREAVLDAFRGRPKPAAASAYFCRSCGERIPDARREAVEGTQFCTFCASQIDKGGR